MTADEKPVAADPDLPRLPADPGGDRGGVDAAGEQVETPTVRRGSPGGIRPLPVEGTCADCADLIAAQRGSLPRLNGPALHIAVGALYGGSPCDHVDYGPEDEAEAGRALYDHALRDRDRARAEVERLREALRRAHEQLSKYDFKGPKQVGRAMQTIEDALEPS